MSLASGLSPIEFTKAVVTALVDEATLAPQTLEQWCSVTERFGRFVQHGLGIAAIEAVGPQQAQAFLDSRQVNGSPATYGAKRVRRNALRRAFRTGRKLGLVKGDPTIDIHLGPPNYVSARALSDEEITAARPYAAGSRGSLRRPIAWALAEATARMNEMGRVHINHVQLECSRVWLPGSSTTDARWGQLTDWGLQQVEWRLRAGARRGPSLIVWRRPPKTLPAACRQAVTETLRLAGLLGSEVKPRSVAAWAGRKTFDEGAPLEAVARMLGMRSLDQTAEFISLDWREQG